MSARQQLIMAMGGIAPPANTVAPAITGTLSVGNVLSCSTGTWTNSPTGYTYQWYRAGSTIGSATSSTYTLVGADAGNAISCRVTATNAAGSVYADSSSTGAIGAGVPGVPTSVSATKTGKTTATVTFTAPSDNGGSSITGYQVVSSPGGITATGSSSPIYVTGLTANTAYTFTVKAQNGIGYGSYSSASNSITTDPLTQTQATYYSSQSGITVPANTSVELYGVGGSRVGPYRDQIGWSGVVTDQYGVAIPLPIDMDLSYGEDVNARVPITFSFPSSVSVTRPSQINFTYSWPTTTYNGISIIGGTASGTYSLSTDAYFGFANTEVQTNGQGVLYGHVPYMVRFTYNTIAYGADYYYAGSTGYASLNGSSPTFAGQAADGSDNYTTTSINSGSDTTLDLTIPSGGSIRVTYYS